MVRSAHLLPQAPHSGGGSAPTLDEVLDLVGRRARVYVEVKALGAEAAVLACLARHPDVRCAVHAFDHRVPVALRAASPALSIGVLSASYPLDLAGFIGPAAPQAFWQAGSLIDQPLVEATHQLGARLIAWTVNDAVHARSLAAMGVDALCTDVPGAIRAALG